jgi:pyruvate,water dikinase
MDWEKGCLEFLRRMGKTTLVVRSSMSVEDDPTASFAGAFESVRVEAPTHKTLWRAVARVLASGFSREAALRILASEIRPGEFTPSAIIQEWVEPAISGVCFSRDPLRPWGSKGIVEWTDLAGTSVVQGEGETRTHPQSDAPPNPSLAPFWDELWEAAARGEHCLLAPADLEWVWDGKQLWFVQLRPVATEEARLLARCASTGSRWSRDLAEERFPEPMTPLGWTAIEDTLAPNLKALDRHFGVAPSSLEGMATSLKGWIYSDPAFFKFPNRVRIRWSRYLASGRGHLSAIFRALGRFAVSRIRKEPLATPVLKTDLALALLEPQAREILGSWPQHLRRHVARISEFKSQTLRRGGTPTRAAVLSRMEDLRALSLSFLEPDLAIFLVKDSLRKALQALWEACGGASREFPDLVAAFEGNRTLDMGREWRSLVETLRKDAGCAAFLERLQHSADAAAALTEPTRKRWDAFLQRNGHCRTSWDVALPSWAEEPSRLAPVLAASLVAGKQSRPSTELSPAERRRAARAFLMARIPKRLEPALQLLEDFMRIDEELHFLSGLLLDPSRYLVLKAGSLLCKEGDLEKPGDVFYLKLSELKGHLRESGPTLRFLARRRRSEWERSRTLALPPEIPPPPPPAEPLLPRPEQPALEAAPGTWTGIPVSPGVAIGRLHAASHLEETRNLPPGAILLTTSPNPALVPLYPLLGGMICSTGGVLSHGFVAAREWGLPAVSGLKDLLDDKELSGRWVKLDGASGSVELLPEGYEP